MSKPPFRDPRLGPAKGPNMCDCGCGQPHKNTHFVNIIDPDTRQVVGTKVFASREHANNWRRKEGML